MVEQFASGSYDIDPVEGDDCGCDQPDVLCIDVVGDVTPAEGLYAQGRFDNYIEALEETCQLSYNDAIHYPFSEVRSMFENSFTIANFESTVLCNPDDAEKLLEDKSKYKRGRYDYFHFGASEYGAASVSPGVSGIDAVSLANNHARDFGVVGLQNTMEVLTAGGLTCFGAGENLEAAIAPQLSMYKGKKIAMIGLSTVVGPDEPDAPLQKFVTEESGLQLAAYKHSGDGIEKHKEFIDQSIAQAKAQGAEVIVVYYHWGTESDKKPRPYQMELGRYAADKGADLIVGAHQHVIQGVEDYTVEETGKKVPIAYGLGNFMFGGNYNPRDKRSVIFRLKYKIEEGGQLTPDGYTVLPVSYTKNKDVKKGKAYENIETCFDAAGRFCPRVAEGEAAKEILDLCAVRSDMIPEAKKDLVDLKRGLIASKE